MWAFMYFLIISINFYVLLPPILKLFQRSERDLAHMRSGKRCRFSHAHHQLEMAV